ncbi:hypothetical protein A2U01_0060431, partial [Trifolium medium]|nr:hypothetical protein [Trifolium medium]
YPHHRHPPYLKSVITVTASSLAVSAISF